MPWTDLKTTYKNASWTGNKKYQISDNQDGTKSITDVTEYSNVADSLFGAGEVNAINDAINKLMKGTAPLATASTPGLVKPDDRTLQVDASGKLSVKEAITLATSSTPGLVKPDNLTLQVDASGKLSVKEAIKIDNRTIKKNSSTNEIYVDFASITANDSYY